MVPPVSLDTATAGVVNPLSARWQAALQQHVQLTQYVEADHKAARREYLKHLMEQNKKVPAPQLSDFCVCGLCCCGLGWDVVSTTVDVLRDFAGYGGGAVLVDSRRSSLMRFPASRS